MKPKILTYASARELQDIVNFLEFCEPRISHVAYHEVQIRQFRSLDDSKRRWAIYVDTLASVYEINAQIDDFNKTLVNLRLGGNVFRSCPQTRGERVKMDQQVGAWYSRGSTVYRLKELTVNGRTKYLKGKPILVNETTIAVYSDSDSSALAETIAEALNSLHNPSA